MEAPAMDPIKTLKEKALNDISITKEEALGLVTADLDALSAAADEIRAHFSGDALDVCAVCSIKGGNCTENCRFCAQSRVSDAQVPQFPLKSSEELLEAAKELDRRGIHRIGLVAAGRRLTDAETEKLCDAIRRIRQETDLLPCVSGGLLTLPQLLQLKDAGIVTIHNNLESSRNYFPSLCSSHSYDDKLKTLQNAKKAGLSICCGGLFGVGESWEDRIDLALTLRGLDPVSVPINLLDPVPGTPLAAQPVLTEPEARRIVSIFRFLLPRPFIRLSAGRVYLPENGRSCFHAGANAAIAGNLLTVKGADDF